MKAEDLTAIAYFAGWRVVRWLPEKIAYQLFDFVADRASAKSGKNFQRLESNLKRVAPELTVAELRNLAEAGMRSYLRYWCDTFRSPDWDSKRIQSTVTVNDPELLLEPVRSKRGVVVALPHAGNWDHAGSYFCSQGVPLVTVVERLKPEKLFRKFLEYRQAIGMEALPLDGRVMGTLASRLREGKLVALVADRDLSRSGIDVKFFNGTARMPAGPALLAIRTGADLVTAYVSYTASGIHIDFRKVEIADGDSESERVARTVQLCANSFAAGISEHPQDWHMLQRIWVDGDFVERS
jgi:phosphatidylinositol dimannoside acyltransferase